MIIKKDQLYILIQFSTSDKVELPIIVKAKDVEHENTPYETWYGYDIVSGKKSKMIGQTLRYTPERLNAVSKLSIGEITSLMFNPQFEWTFTPCVEMPPISHDEHFNMYREAVKQYV